MQALIMPSVQNRALLNILRKEYISERFDFFMRETASRCMVVYPEEEISSSKLLLLMDKVILHTVVTMYTQDRVSDFVRSVQCNHFGCVVDLTHAYVREFFTDITVPYAVNPYDVVDSDDTLEAENSLRRSITNYINRMYKENTEPFNQALMSLMWVCHEQLPRAIKLHRVELTETLSPIILCEQQFQQVNTRFL